MIARAAAVLGLLLATSTAHAGDELAALQRRFADRTGAALVFARDELPRGTWYDDMPVLDHAQQVAAARLLVGEAARYPAGWLGELGLRKVGVFAALVSAHGDGFRPYDETWKGYLYYGLWNGADGIAAAYYTDGQLPLTFHHEVFHHVDGASGFERDDARFAAAVAGTAAYPALAIDAADVAALAARAGAPLDGAVGDYAAKSAGEDQAETARWLMSHLATGLWQATVHPELPGSQRILHVIAEYAAAPSAGASTGCAVPECFVAPAGQRGPDAAWLVDSALGRDPGARRKRATFTAAVAAGERAILDRLAPTGEPAFVVWGREVGGGGNPTLRADLAQVGTVAARIGSLAPSLGATAADRKAAGARLHGVLVRYQAFIAARWSITETTAAAFADAHVRIEAALPSGRAPAPRTNRYLAKVDAAIRDPAWRAAIRAVQPATVRIGGGSGVNLAADGLVLTAGHVVDRVGAVLVVRFPDGREYPGVAIRFDDELDLGLVKLEGAQGLPIATLAAAAPKTGDDVAVIGQPGTRTPDGEPTGYQPWHVSTGTIRGFRAGSRTGEQHLGRTKHDAWTYWGHSGSPLFDRAGHVVALHNSWDSSTAMRHAVTWEAIVKFLDDDH